ncbi:MAG: IS4 family transposase [Acidobacteriota bacterium]
MEHQYYRDRRIGEHFDLLLNRIKENESISIRKISKSRSEQRQFYRLLASPKFTEDKIVRQFSDECRERVTEGSHILAIHDTTVMCYRQYSGRIKAQTGLGPTGNMSIGFYLHPVLAIRSEDENLLGFPYIYRWIKTGTDDERKKKRKKRAQRDIEDKETYKWILSAERSKSVLRRASMVTFIADRDSEFYEYWATVPDEKTHVISRSNHDRRIEESTDGLFSYLSGQSLSGEYTITVNDLIYHQEVKRQAKVELRFAEVTIIRPNIAALYRRGYPDKIKLRAIEARETDDSVPDGGHRVLWRLMTTHSVEDFSQAMQIVTWYTKRWYIEQLFRTLKKKGFDCEDSLLGTGEALRKLALSALDSAMKVMLLILARGGKSQQKAENTFDKEELDCLEVLNKDYEGKIASQKNPFKKRTIPWVSWIIGRMGGWKGTKSERPAGPITMYTGLDKFNKIMIGWRLKNLQKLGPP